MHNPLYAYRESTAAFIINSKSELLLVQPNDYDSNSWTLPGGGIDDNENSYQTVIREIQEETGIRERSLEFLGMSKYVNKYTFSEEMADRYHIAGQLKHQFVFECTADIDIVNGAREIRSHRWVDINEIDTYLVFNGQLENAKRVLNEFKFIQNN